MWCCSGTMQVIPVGFRRFQTTPSDAQEVMWHWDWGCTLTPILNLQYQPPQSFFLEKQFLFSFSGFWFFVLFWPHLAVIRGYYRLCSNAEDHPWASCTESMCSNPVSYYFSGPFALSLSLNCCCNHWRSPRFDCSVC